jgi:hypothetical protein
MVRPSAVLQLPIASTPSLATVRRLYARAHEACQIAFLIVYLAAAMTPQIRRALIGLDRG